MVCKQSEEPVFFLATGLHGWIVATLSTLSVLLKYICSEWLLPPFLLSYLFADLLFGEQG